MIRIQLAQDRLISQPSAPVFKNLHIGVFGNGAPDLLRKSHRAVMRIVMADETTNETDYDVRRSGNGLSRRRRGIRLARQARSRRTENRRSDKQNNEYGAK